MPKTPALRILTGESAGSIVQLTKDVPQVFGREPSADICLPEKRISRRHAQITWDSHAKRITLEDLQSLNGTYVNGVLIESPVFLKAGDRIQMGSFLLEFDEHSDGIREEPSESSKETRGKRKIEEALLELSDIQVKQAENRISEISEVQEQTGGRLIGGKLSEISLPDLLQLFATTRKTGHLVVSKHKILFAPKGAPKDKKKIFTSLYIENGILIHAEYGTIFGFDAFLESLKLEGGFFALFPHLNFNVSKPLNLPLEVALLDGLRRLDEMRAFTKEPVAEDMFDVNIDSDWSSLEPDQLKIFQLIWKQKKVGAVWALSPLDRKTTNYIIKELLRKNFLRPA